MIIKYLSVGQWSWFSYQHVALNVLFQMRYESTPNSKKQPSDRQRAETPPVFTPLKAWFVYCFALCCSPGVCRHSSAFWSVTLQPLGADQSTIPHMKGDIHSSNMGYTSSILSTNRLQRYGFRNFLNRTYLVLYFHWLHIRVPVSRSNGKWSKTKIRSNSSGK